MEESLSGKNVKREKKKKSRYLDIATTLLSFIFPTVTFFPPAEELDSIQQVLIIEKKIEVKAVLCLVSILSLYIVI